jgi:acetylornithine/LysW-gamma-L-lysine aminotransferase
MKSNSGRHAIEDSSELTLYNKRGISLVRGSGVHLWDADGRRYLDAMSNYGVNILGHAHPAVNAAVRDQLDRLSNCHQSFYNDARERFEQTFRSVLPPTLTRIAYANSGTEANEAAIKFARVATGRRRIVSAIDGYHGRTLGSLSVTGVAKYRDGFLPLLDGCDQIPFDNTDALEEAISDAAAVMLEPIQGESGVHLCSETYLSAVRALCDRHGTLMILDEIQTGMGRTGKMFAFEHANIVPDILTVAKGIANGLPMGVTVTTEAVGERIRPGSHGGTFSGNPLVCAAAAATIQTIQKTDLLTHVGWVGDRFIDGLRSIEHRLIRETRGHGLMVAMELRTRVTPVLKALQDSGVIALSAGNRAIRFLPPLIITESQVDEIVDRLRDSLSSVDAMNVKAP